ncbi:hypothetical protein ACWERY_02375 [Streptomyces sp. NPDC004082]
MAEPVDFLTVTLADGSERVRLDRLTDGRIMCQLCFAHLPVDQLNPVDGGVEDICKPCARVERLRGIDAHITHGSKYHTDGKCPRLVSGEMLHDWDGDDYGGSFLAGGYRIVSNIHDAIMRGKLPCLGCVPADLREYPPLYGQTFGHRPVEVFGEQCCARCRDRGIDEYGDPWIHPTIWPCTSAVILGLVPRTEAAA